MVCCSWIGMLPIPVSNPNSQTPLYRQLYETIKALIDSGGITNGTRLPATRELAGQLGLNRTTISAAYALLESEGLITGHVGRGSFVASKITKRTQVNWRELLDPSATASPAAPAATPHASFASSRPSELLFPLEEFRATCAEVIASAGGANDPAAGLTVRLSAAAPLPSGAGARGRRRSRFRRHSDHQRLPAGFRSDPAHCWFERRNRAASKTPCISGVKHVFERSGARLVGVPMAPNGIDLDALERIVERERPRLLAVTSNFQNPTGATLPLAGAQGTAWHRAAQPAWWWSKTTSTDRSLMKASRSRPSSAGRNRRHDPAAEFFQSRFSRAARGLGHRAASADRKADRDQTVDRSAQRSALAGRAAALRRIGPAGAASAAHAGGRSRAAACGAGALAKNICRPKRN